MDNHLDYNQIDNIIKKTRKFNNDYMNNRNNLPIKDDKQIDKQNDPNTSGYFPPFEEILSTFKKIIQEADNEVNSSLRTSESIRSFEVKKQCIPRANSRASSNNSSRVSVLSDRINNQSRTSILSDGNNNSFKSGIPSRCHNSSRTSMITQTSNSNFNRLSRRKSSVAEKRSKSKLLANQQANFDRKQSQSDFKSADSDDEKSRKKILNGSIVDKCPKLPERLALDNYRLNLLRTRNESKLVELVRMHLLIQLDLDGDNFSNVFEDTQSVKKLNTLKKKKQDKNDKGLFQQALTEEGICRLYILTDFISKPENINQEGIFRKCGSTARQQELKYKLVKNINFNLDNENYTVHDCANVLKACLSELPEPLLTDLFFKIISQKLSSTENNGRCFNENDFNKVFGDKNLKIVQLILLLMPFGKRKLAKVLLCLLNQIASKENSANKMDAKSLATLFVPHLLCPKTMAPVDLQRYITILTLQLEYMIKNVKQIFKAPAELTLDIKKELERSSDLDISKEDEGEGGVINTQVTFCTRQPEPTDQTARELSALYAYINLMPESATKKKLISKFNGQNGGLTPLMDKENSKKKQNKFKSIGEKVKNVKNLFKVNSTVKNGKRDDELASSSTNLNNDSESNSSCDRKFEKLNQIDQVDSYKRPNDFVVLSPNKKAQKSETPLADLTVTKFCIDDEEDSSDLLMFNKKLGDSHSSSDDHPWSSESILL